MRDARVFLKLLQLDLAANPPNAPVTKVFLAAEPVRPQVAQHGLFRPMEPQPEKLELMLARINGIVGAGRVGSPELLDTHRPDAFRMQRFVSAQNNNSPRRRGGAEKRKVASTEYRVPSEEVSSFKFQVSSSGIRQFGDFAKNQPPTTTGQSQFGNSAVPQFGNAEGQRPKTNDQRQGSAFRFFRPPRAARVVLRDGVPARVSCAGEQGPRGDVTWSAGPWRSSGDWWQDAPENDSSASGPWRREEWDVLINGAVYRLVRAGGEAEWQVDGAYD
jgi:hypothetical protein